MNRFKCYNGAMVTTAAPAYVTTGTAIKTMLQIATPSTRQCQLLAWGYSLDAPQNGVVELLQTDVSATVTAHISAGVQNLDPNGPATLMSLGAAATGYTATAEGVITATREFDVVHPVSTTGNLPTHFEHEFVPDMRPIVAASRFVRVRCTMAVATNMLTWAVWDE